MANTAPVKNVHIKECDTEFDLIFKAQTFLLDRNLRKVLFLRNILSLTEK